MSNKYDVLKDTNERLEVQAKQRMTQHSMLRELQRDGMIAKQLAIQIINDNADRQLCVGDTLTVEYAQPITSSRAGVSERSSKAMAKRVMDTLVKQYAPDADTAWSWMRQAHEIGWEWGNHHVGGPSPSDPLGQRVNKSVATAFSNDAGVYVGICLVGGCIRWGWFRAEEWGPRGRDLVLAGGRNHHETPIAAIAEYSLLGESTPMKGVPLDDVFGGTWDD